MEERERREGGVEVGEENEGKRKKQKQHRLMTSLREENDKAQLCVCVCARTRVCCSHSTKWKEFGQCTQATAG